MKKVFISLLSLFFVFGISSAIACSTCGCQNKNEVKICTKTNKTCDKKCENKKNGTCCNGNKEVKSCDKNKKSCCSKKSNKSSCNKNKSTKNNYSKKNNYSNKKTSCNKSQKSCCSKKTNNESKSDDTIEEKTSE